MDLALLPILIFFLLLPGLLFRRFYYTEEFSKEYFKESLPSFFLATAIPSCLIHLVCWQFVTYWYDINVRILGVLVSGTDDPGQLEEAFDGIIFYGLEIFWYFIFLAVFSSLLGKLCKFIVRKTKWDRTIKLFRFQNEWHYIFSGEVLDFPRVPGEATEIDFTYVDVLVEKEGDPIIYMGMLSDYVLSRDGGIDRIILSYVKRRFLSEDGSTDYYVMPGAFFVIPFSKVLNIHLTYYQAEVSTTSVTATTTEAPETPPAQ